MNYRTLTIKMSLLMFGIVQTGRVGAPFLASDGIDHWVHLFVASCSQPR